MIINVFLQLGGMQVGIVRLGNIGSEVLNRLQAFGFIISYNSRRKRPSVLFPYCANVYDPAVNSDVLVVCCALTEQTHHIINKDVMAELGKGGMIINVGRGALIDEKEMLQFLVQGDINGVGLDVFENDPNVPKEPLRLDNIVLLPCQNALTHWES